MSIKRLFVCGLALLAGCAPIAVQTDYDPDVDFSSYQTYGFLPRSMSEQERASYRFSPELFEKKLHKSVRAALAERGLQYASNNPDLLITFHANVRHRQDVYDAQHGYNSWKSAVVDVDVHEYREGTLVLDFIDRRTNDLVWRGIGTGTTEGIDSPEDLQKRLDKAVSKMVSKYPPKP